MITIANVLIDHHVNLQPACDASVNVLVGVTIIITSNDTLTDASLHASTVNYDQKKNITPFSLTLYK